MTKQEACERCVKLGADHVMNIDSETSDAERAYHEFFIDFYAVCATALMRSIKSTKAAKRSHKRKARNV